MIYKTGRRIYVCGGGGGGGLGHENMIMALWRLSHAKIVISSTCPPTQLTNHGSRRMTDKRPGRRENMFTLLVLLLFHMHVHRGYCTQYFLGCLPPPLEVQTWPVFNGDLCLGREHMAIFPWSELSDYCNLSVILLRDGRYGSLCMAVKTWSLPSTVAR